jgi:pectate lyase/lysophospholipase L1-like esterase
MEEIPIEDMKQKRMSRLLFTIGFAAILSFYCVATAQAFENTPIGYASMPGNPNDANYHNANGTTGGGNSEPNTVTTAEDFIAAATSTSPAVIYVIGDFDVGALNIGSDKTIIGVGSTAALRGNIQILNGVHNVIIRNLSIRNDSGAGDGDCITIKRNDDYDPPVHHIWIDHCELYDSTDGLLDISRAADYVTVSWCEFYYTSTAVNPVNRYPCLVGGDDLHTADAGHLLVTYHHNWWSTLCQGRMPRVRYGPVHVFNNYYSSHGNEYCVGVGVNCQIRVEDNYFDDTNLPWTNYSGGDTQGKIGWNSNNQFMNGTTIPTWAPNDYNTIFTPPYSYTLDSGANVKTIVMDGAGVGKISDGNSPGQASNPTPVNNATNVSITQDISWTGGPNTTSYDIYFGIINPPPFAGNQTDTTYDAGTMASDTTYYWRIDGKNADRITTGIVWSFTTVSPDPGAATDPTPATGATNVSLTQDLSWTAGSGATSHDVYFGTVDPPPFIGNQTETMYDAGTMAASTTYYWRINEKNGDSNAIGDVWIFTTVPPLPGQAADPVPNNTATNINFKKDLSWTQGSGATSHDVYFGTVNPPPFITNQAGTTYDTGTMAFRTTYYWRIDEKNAGGTTTGEIWSFTTTAVEIMPLGDSITCGVGTTPYNGYRKPLYNKLTAAGYSFNFVGSQTDGNFPDPHHEGYIGWHADAPGTTNDILGQVYNWLTANPAGIVLLHIGTNDITSGGQDVNEINSILDEIDRFSTDIKVILALIINRAPHSPATTQFNIDVNNMAQNRIAAGDDIIIVNMESALNYATDMSDDKHPNNSGYTKMADMWFNALNNILPPSITSTPTTNVTVFEQYSYDVNASGCPAPTYELITCPNGMTIDQDTGLIEWRPTATGDFNVTVKASNDQIPDANQSFVITVNGIIKFGTASSDCSSSDGNTLSWQHTIITGIDKRILVVGLAGDDNDANDLVINIVKYNDVNMALVEGSSIIVGSGDPISYTKTELYYLLDDDLPSSPGDYNIEVIYNGNISNRCGGAISLANVNQVEREAVAVNSNVDQNTISTNITTQTNSACIIDIVGCGSTGSFLALADDMTERFDVNSVSSTAAGSTTIVESAGETTISWTHSDANRLAHSAAVFAPSSRIISGHISQPNDTPIEGVLVSAATGGSDITDANGYYEVWVSYDWLGTVTPEKTECLFTPSERTYNNVVTDLPDQNYKNVWIYDLDSSGFIGWGDIRIIGENWLDSGQGDFNEDNIVNFVDFAEFATAW